MVNFIYNITFNCDEKIIYLLIFYLKKYNRCKQLILRDCLRS